MEEKIKEVQAYFKNKIIAGDYKVTSATSDRIKLLVDELYVFDFMYFTYANIAPSLANIRCFINIDFTDEEKTKILNDLNQILLDAKKAERYAEFEAIKKELGL